MTITNFTDLEIQQAARIKELEAALVSAGRLVDLAKEQIEEMEAAIEASREQKPVAYRAWFDADNGARWLFTLWLEEEKLDVQWEPLYAAPVVADDVMKDAQRYRWLREQSWLNSLCVVDSPKNSVKLGSFCPSHGRLDVAIDQAMVAQLQQYGDDRAREALEMAAQGKGVVTCRNAYANSQRKSNE